MKPLENCGICKGEGEYLDRYEEAWGRRIPIYERCPCRDRECDEIYKPIEFDFETIKKFAGYRD